MEIGAIWNYFKSILMMGVNIRKLSNQISKLQEQLSSPVTYREELELIKSMYKEKIELFKHEKEKAKKENDLKRAAELQEVISKLEEFANIINKQRLAAATAREAMNSLLINAETKRTSKKQEK